MSSKQDQSATSEADRNPLVHLRVDEAQKEKWEQHAEESDMYMSLSDFIRKAAETQIKDDTGQISLEVEQLQETMESEVEGLSDDIEQLKTDVAWLRSNEEHDIESFAHKLFSVLEPIPTETIEQEESAKAVTAGLDPHRKQDLADKLNSNQYRVEQALEWLNDHNMPVIKYEIEGETHYFRDTKEREVNDDN